MIYVVAGLAIPYDVEAVHDFRRWRLLPGALRAAGDRVPFLRDHDQGQRLGWITWFMGTTAGLRVRGWSRVPVPAGTALSAKFTVLDSLRDAGAVVVRRAVLDEVSMVRRGAYADAVTTEEEEVPRWPDTRVRTSCATAQ